MSLLLLLNGLANNAIIPIEHKMTVVFELPDSYVSSSVFVSFLVFSIFNFPANQMIDSHGLRTSFLFGTVLFTIGLMLYTLVN